MPRGSPSRTSWARRIASAIWRMDLRLFIDELLDLAEGVGLLQSLRIHQNALGPFYQFAGFKGVAQIGVSRSRARNSRKRAIATSMAGTSSDSRKGLTM